MKLFCCIILPLALLLPLACSKSPDPVSLTHPAFQAYLSGLPENEKEAWQPCFREGEPTIWTTDRKENEVLWLEAREAAASVDAAFPAGGTARPGSLLVYRFTNRVDMARVIQSTAHALPRGAADGPHMFLLRGPEQDHGETFAHEWAHVRIREHYPNLPLWLEEGWAMHLGEQAARRLAKERMLPFTPAREILRPGGRVEDHSRRFYRIAGQAVRDLEQGMTGDGWRTFLAAAEAGEDLRTVVEPLVEGWSPVDREFLWTLLDSTVASAEASR